jgi:DNA-binding MarR family transcriptional regulator
VIPNNAGPMVLLTNLSRAIYRRASEEMLGMRLKQVVALSFLRGRDPVTQQALGDDLMIDPNNVVLLLNEMEERGHIVRRRDPSDRRRHIVEITPEGEKALERAEDAMESVEDDVLRGLSEKERAKLHDLLARAAGGLAAVDPHLARTT